MKTACFALICLLVVAASALVWRGLQTRSNRQCGQPQRAAQAVTLSQPSLAQDSAPQAAAPAGAAQGGESEERLGPFPIAGHDYSVLLREKKRRPGATQESGETVVAMQIQDATGAVVYQRTFPYQEETEDFSDASFVSAGLLTGARGSGLLVNYSEDSEPSAPEPEPTESWQVFGVVNGKLRPFSGPISVQGGLVPSEELKTGNKTTGYKTAGPLEAQSDALEFRVWAHHFRLIYPVRVDWAQGKLSPGQPCEEAATGGSNAACQYKVEPEDLSNRDEVTFVRFCPNPAQKCDKPERVLVKKDSKVEMVACQAQVAWSEGVASGPSGDPQKPMDDEGGIGVAEDDVWLKLHVDGKEGWMNSVEDFNVLSLPFEQ
jgi:hypothetical protein